MTKRASAGTGQVNHTQTHLGVEDGEVLVHDGLQAPRGGRTQQARQLRNLHSKRGGFGGGDGMGRGPAG